MRSWCKKTFQLLQPNVQKEILGAKLIFIWIVFVSFLAEHGTLKRLVHKPCYAWLPYDYHLSCIPLFFLSLCFKN